MDVTLLLVDGVLPPPPLVFMSCLPLFRKVYKMSVVLVLQVFALSATEVGSLISLGPNGSCEFFHDPAIKTRLIFVVQCVFRMPFLLALNFLLMQHVTFQ